jgi:7-cyano-7-deazaguanine synthase
MEKALVVLSGGQDSTTCLYWAIDKFGENNIDTITFDYGQRHSIELESAKKVAQIARVSNIIFPIDTFKTLGGNSLTDDNMDVKNELNPDTQLPTSFVPGRNLIFLTYAAAYAYQRNIKNIVTGVAQTDYSGYPDCREDTIKALNKSINLGMEYDFIIHTPLMHKTKAETVFMAKQDGAFKALSWSHTCYNGKYPPCKKCASCILRAKGFEEAGINDPIYSRGK